MKLQCKSTIDHKDNSVQKILKRTGVSIEISPSYSMSDSVAYQYKPKSSRKAFTEDYLKTKIYTLSSISVPLGFTDLLLVRKVIIYPQLLRTCKKFA